MEADFSYAGGDLRVMSASKLQETGGELKLSAWAAGNKLVRRGSECLWIS